MGFVVWRRGRVEVPLHEVRIRVFDGLTTEGCSDALECVA